jgi:hypothetical protein
MSQLLDLYQKSPNNALKFKVILYFEFLIILIQLSSLNN